MNHQILFQNSTSMTNTVSQAKNSVYRAMGKSEKHCHVTKCFSSKTLQSLDCQGFTRETGATQKRRLSPSYTMISNYTEMSTYTYGPEYQVGIHMLRKQVNLTDLINCRKLYKIKIDLPSSDAINVDYCAAHQVRPEAHAVVCICSRHSLISHRFWKSRILLISR